MVCNLWLHDDFNSNSLGFWFDLDKEYLLFDFGLSMEQLIDLLCLEKGSTTLMYSSMVEEACETENLRRSAIPLECED